MCLCCLRPHQPKSPTAEAMSFHEIEWKEPFMTSVKAAEKADVGRLYPVRLQSSSCCTLRLFSDDAHSV
jgi:hypothetical protein